MYILHYRGAPKDIWADSMILPLSGWILYLVHPYYILYIVYEKNYVYIFCRNPSMLCLRSRPLRRFGSQKPVLCSAGGGILFFSSILNVYNRERKADITGFFCYRAGRCSPGVCYHLCSRVRYESFQEFQIPELLRFPLQVEI